MFTESTLRFYWDEKERLIVSFYQIFTTAR